MLGPVEVHEFRGGVSDDLPYHAFQLQVFIQAHVVLRRNGYGEIDGPGPVVLFQDVQNHQVLHPQVSDVLPKRTGPRHGPR